MLALLAVVPEDYDTRGREAFPISEMARKSFIISAEGVDYDVHEALEIADITPDTKFSSKDDHVILSMVSSHLGVSILPKLVIGHTQEAIKTLPLEPSVTRELGIALRNAESITPAAQKFIECIQKILPEMI